MLLPAYGAQASSTRCRVSGWQERWQINYHVPSVKRRAIPPMMVARPLRHGSKRMNMDRRSSPVFLEPK